MLSRFSCILNYIGLQVIEIEIYRQCNWKSELPYLKSAVKQEPVNFPNQQTYFDLLKVDPFLNVDRSFHNFAKKRLIIIMTSLRPSKPPDLCNHCLSTRLV